MRRILKFLSVTTIALLALTMGLGALEREPGGNNLLNPAYLGADFAADSIFTETSLPVEPDTIYTFQLDTGYGDVFEIYLDGQLIISDMVQDTSECEEVSNTVFCTFNTENATSFDFVMSGRYASLLYDWDNYLMLSENDGPLPWEPFEPVNDTEPVIHGEAYMMVSYDAPIDPYALIGDAITAEDEIDGDLTEKIDIVRNDYRHNEGMTGEYTVIYEVSDTANNTAHLHLTIDVVDHIPPVIDGPSDIHTDVDALHSLATLIDTHFTFTDDYDGPIENYTVTSDDYSNNKGTLGSYGVSVTVSDASGNTTSHIFTVHVEDYEKPELDGPDTIAMALSAPYATLDDILSYYQIHDNYTPTNDLEFTIGEHTVPEALDERGTYQLELVLEDCSGNQETKHVTFIIIDDIPPVLEGTSHIRIPYHETFDIEAYIASMHVADNHDTLTTDDIIVSVNHYDEAEGFKVGFHNVVFTLSDESGNLTEFILHIEVYDDIPPVFHVNDEMLVQSGLNLSSADVFSHLTKSSHIAEFNPVEMIVIDDEYTENRNVPGSYEYTVELRNAMGDAMTTSATIRVTDAVVEETHDFTPWLTAGMLGMLAVGILIIRRKRS